MCRIVGWKKKGQYYDNSVDDQLIYSMIGSLIHGGPDGEGVYIDHDEGVALGHTRLAVLDLSDCGHQPMSWENWVITFNGEIYNFRSIKDELISLGYTFNSNSDTEVVLKAFNCWNFAAIDKFRGMFAFALWNKLTKKLILCRDRVGVKPLYYYHKDGLFMFSSELKAFHMHPDFDKEIDVSGLPFYFKKGYFNESSCIYKYVKKVPPASILEFGKESKIKIYKYWDINQVAENAVIKVKSEQECINELEIKMQEAFNLRMISDVEVGVFLSGGIDSSVVAALLQKDRVTPIRTFTIGFEDKKYDESVIAEEIAQQLGTNHTSVICTDEDLKIALPELPYIYDEPFGDISAIPTILVSKIARKNVKVALSGDGGDELFGGYSKYKFIYQNRGILNVPIGVRKMLYDFSKHVEPGVIEKIASKLSYKGYSQIGDKYHKLKETLLAKNLDDLFDRSSSFCNDQLISEFTSQEISSIISKKLNGSEGLISYMGLKDMVSYLPGDILTKVDRASMSVALEAREPFLDHKLIEYSFTIPDHLKISKEGKNKYLVRRVLEKYVDRELIDRPKQGFSVSIKNWLKTYLRHEIEAMSFDYEFFRVFGLNQSFFQKLLTGFFQGQDAVNAHFIWFVFTLYKWHKQWK
ncbi:asparagine synthase (glutamine-hydrolyzing) [Sediminibacterium sp. C3]|uniref:asparagine synthase (glutamine-hydrolyzing) n=1 Tax=Sediminibacterium sp. C3 TaxID=1267211 RepID=UPI00040C71B3|nr:asparagine synthase (glutamine-hydrolyzing) [Sediminibacterium sp. C3]